MPITIRTRSLRLRALIARSVPPGSALLAALASAAALVACGSTSSTTSTTATVTTNLNTKRVARAIEDSIHTQRHLRYRVTCPTLVPQEQGRTFECIASGRNAKHKRSTTPFLVTIQNRRGYVTYVGK